MISVSLEIFEIILWKIHTQPPRDSWWGCNRAAEAANALNNQEGVLSQFPAGCRPTKLIKLLGYAADPRNYSAGSSSGKNRSQHYIIAVNFKLYCRGL